MARLSLALQSTFRAMCGAKLDLWTLNLGHNQCHVNGPVMLLNRLGLIKAANEDKPGALLTAGGLWKQLTPEAGRAQLERWIAMADEVGELGSPTTCREWIDMHIEVHDAIVRHKVRGLQGRFRVVRNYKFQYACSESSCCYPGCSVMILPIFVDYKARALLLISVLCALRG